LIFIFRARKTAQDSPCQTAQLLDVLDQVQVKQRQRLFRINEQGVGGGFGSGEAGGRFVQRRAQGSDILLRQGNPGADACPKTSLNKWLCSFNNCSRSIPEGARAEPRAMPSGGAERMITGRLYWSLMRLATVLSTPASQAGLESTSAGCERGSGHCQFVFNAWAH
jgi:hypothetical protein